MHKLPQESFAHPLAGDDLGDQALIVHQRDGQPSNRNLLVFVHGLGGSRYGSSPTWGNFPKFLLDELPHVDVGLYSYRTLWGRLQFWKSIRLDREAEIFAQQLRDEPQYRNILLIGHSMGGLLCKAAVQWLIEAEETTTLDRLQGLILMAVPQAGSIRVPGFARFLSSDAQVLTAHGDFVTSVERTFQNSVSTDADERRGKTVHLPTYAVKAASDFWVDRLSAGLNLPDKQMKTVHGSHTSFVKPKNKDDEGYKYVRDRLAKLLPAVARTPRVVWTATMAATPDATTEVRAKVFHVPHERNRNFIGRDELLTLLHEALTSERSAALTQTLHGLGGIGKTQLAVEYAYRNAGDYDYVWWVRAEEAVTRDGDLAGLAKVLGLPEADAQDQRSVIEAVRTWLSGHDRWLLVLDNVPHPKDLDGVLPTHPLGHILITSRDPNWHERATPLKVDVFERPVSVEFLLNHSSPTRERGVDHSLALRAEDTRLADQLAEQLGDLPLALAQAVGYMEETQSSIGKYLELFRARRGGLLRAGHGPLGHQETVAITFGLSIGHLEKTSEVSQTSEVSRRNLAAVDLLNVCTFLAPDNIPRSLFAAGGEHFPARLAAVVSDEFSLNAVLAVLRSYSLIELTPESLSVHRLLQVVCRDRLQTSEVSKTSEVSASKLFAAAAVKLVNAAFPGDVLTNLASWPIIKELLPHANEAATHAEQLGVEPEATGLLLNQVGVYSEIRAHFVKAKDTLQRAVRICEKAFGPDHPKVAVPVNNLGNVLHDLGDLAGARQAYERALRIDEQAFGPDHPRVARSVNNLGRVLHDNGDLPGARRAFERALQLDEQAFGPDHRDVARDVNNLGGVLLHLRELAEAEKAFRRALKIGEKVLGPDHPEVAIFLNSVGLVLQENGDRQGAKQAYERALKINELAFGPDHPKVGIRVNNIGNVLQAFGELQEAKQAYERALVIFKKCYGEEHAETKNTAKNLALVNQQLEEATRRIG